MAVLLIKNIGLLQTPIGGFRHTGEAQAENKKLKNAAILAENGIIKEITSSGALPHGESDADKIIDAGGRLVTPGLVDGHAHLIFGGYRQHEIPLKLRGASYLDILRAGGGIMDTVRKTREASHEQLYYKTKGFLDEMMSLGVTSCEVKSGYGLDFETEIKLLEVLNSLEKDHNMDIVPTFMAAHAVEDCWKGREEEYIRICCDEMMPYVKENGLAQYVDIFTEDSVFNVEQSRIYLEKAKQLGFKIRIHADEIEAIGGSVLAGEMGAVSAEHLIVINDEGMKSMAKGGTIAMCLPATSFYLGAGFAPARRMIDEFEIPVALASDFNPGSCPSLNLQLVMNLGYLKYKMLPEEILTAVTINPACAIGKEKTIGTLEVGKQADMVIWNAEDMEMLCYRFGSNLVNTVIKKGNVI